MDHREYQLDFCNRCEHHQFDLQSGVVCGLTNQPADFDRSCPNFVEDPKRADAYKIQKINRKKIQLEHETGGLNKYGIKDGRIAGGIIAGIGFFYFVIALSAGRLSAYSLIMLLGGSIFFARGVAAARKRGKKKQLPEVLDSEL